MAEILMYPLHVEVFNCIVCLKANARHYVKTDLGVTSKLNRRLTAQNRRSGQLPLFKTIATAQNRRLRAVNSRLSFEVIP